MRVIVRMQQVVENVQVTSRIRVSEIAKHFRLSPVKSFDDCGLQILVFAGVKLYAATTQHGLKRRIHKLGTFVTLQHVAISVGQYFFECFRDVLTGLPPNRNRPRPLAKHVSKYLDPSLCDKRPDTSTKSI